MKHRVGVLRVIHMLAGRVVPFDRIYFFEKESERVIPRAFEHALVIHPNKSFAAILGRVSTSTYKPISGKAYPMKRSDEVSLKQEVFSSSMVDHVVANYNKYVIAIPILMLKHPEGLPKVKPNDKPVFPAIQPSYLHARLKMPNGATIKSKPDNNEIVMRNLRKMSKNTFTSKSYFLSRKRIFKPICAACSDSLKMLNGECFIGHQNCYDGLMRQDRSTIRNNIRAYANWMKRFNEPEIQDEQLR